MALLFPGHHGAPARYLRRLDRAAARMTPLLVMIAIGLAILNLTCFILMAQHFPITRLTPGLEACPASDASDAQPTPSAKTVY